MGNCIERDIFVLRDVIARPIEYVQGTNALSILLHLRDFEISSDSKAKVYVHRPSTKGEYDSATIIKNDVKIDVKDTMFSEVGKSSLQVSITNGDKTLVTFSYPVFVKENKIPGITEPSKNKSDFLDEYLDRIETNMGQTEEYKNKAVSSASTASTAATQAKTSEINAKQSEANSKASEKLAKEYMEKTFLGTPDGYQQLVEEVGLLDIKTTTDRTLQGSKAGGAKLNHLIGATEQKQYNGYQLFDASKLPNKTQGGASCVNNEDGSFTVSGSGTLSSNFDDIAHTYTHEETVKILKPGKIKLAGVPEGTIATIPYIYMRVEVNNSGVVSIYRGDTTTGIEITQEMLDDESCVLKLGYWGTKDDPIKTGTFKPMFYIDGDGTWEPFVGGQQSPSPEYPQSMNNTGDCVEMINGAWSRSSGNFDANRVGTFLCSKHFIPCNCGDYVKVILEKPLRYSILYYNNASLISYETFEGTEINTEYICTIPNNITHFKFNIGGNGDYAVRFEAAGKIQLTINDKYVGQIVETGKNLFDISEALRGSFKNGDYIITNELANFYNYSFKENTQYTFSAYICNSSDFGNGRFRIIYTDGTIEKEVLLNKDTEYKYVTHTSKAGKTISSLGIYFGSPGRFSIKNGELQIEEGDAATPYAPFTQKIHTYYTEKPMMAGDSIVPIGGKWCEKHVMREEIFDGSDDEVWVNENTRVYISASNMKLLPNAWSIGNAFCDSFQQARRDKNTTENTFSLDNSISRLWFCSDCTSQVATWKEHLQLNPIKTQYELAEPLLIELDTASQIALNSLETFDDVTYIEVDSRVQPQEVSVDYGTSRVGARVLKAENDNLIDYVERQEMKAQLNELAVAIASLGSEV